MKKITALAAALVLCAAHVSAYENSYAGYSVKDGQPYYKLEAKKVYAYTNISSKKAYQNEEDLKNTAVNIVNYYTAEDMEQILGEKFSTAYFDAEYEKLALLERSQLNPKTVPAPLLELEKYAEHDSNGNVTIQSKVLKEKLDQLTPVIKVGKIAGKKAITISYIYKQSDVLFKIDTSMVSANDRLYLLSTVNSDQDVYAPKKDEKAADADTDVDIDDIEDIDTDEAGSEDEAAKTKPQDVASIKEAVEKAMQVENVALRDIPAETMQRFDKAHTDLLKGFKAFAPTSTPKAISFTDTAVGKSVQLPDDWFYGQLNLRYKNKGTFYLTMASSMKQMQDVAANTDYDNIYSVFAIPASDPEYQQKFIDLYTNGMRNVLEHWNHLLVTVSVDNINDADADIDDIDTDAESDENDEAKTEPKSAASAKEEMDKALEVENVFVRDVPAETMQRFAKAHTDLLKGFKAFAPTSTPKAIGFTDAAAGKSVQLPDDWFYGQLNLKYKDKGTFYLTLASSMKEMQEVAANTDYDSVYSVLAIPQADPEYQKKVTELYSSGARNVLQHWNHLLITASVDNITDAEIKELLSTPVANRLAVESFISEGLQRMKGFSNEYFALKDYKTNFDFTQEKALIGINADTDLLKDFAYNNKILLSCNQKAATAMLFIKKTDVETKKSLEQQVNEWHF